MKLSDEAQARGLAALAAAREPTKAMRERRGGRPMAESWPDINRARDERSRQLLDG